MTPEITLQEVATRLQTLEIKVNEINSQLFLQPSKQTEQAIEFIIFADDQQVWQGIDIHNQIPKIISQYPNAQISLQMSSIPFVWI